MISRNTRAGAIAAGATLEINLGQLFPREYAKKTALGIEVSNPTAAAIEVQLDTRNNDAIRVDPHTSRPIDRPATGLIITNLDALVNIAVGEINIEIWFDL